MSEEDKEELQELINLLYNNHLSQYGKRKLGAYMKTQQKELDKKDKIIDLLVEDLAQGCNYEEFEYQKQKIKEYFTNKVEEQNII